MTRAAHQSIDLTRSVHWENAMTPQERCMLRFAMVCYARLSVLGHRIRDMPQEKFLATSMQLQGCHTSTSALLR